MDFQQRRGTSAEWAAANPILRDGMIGYDRTLNKIKVGDGVTPWVGLTFSEGGGGADPEGWVLIETVSWTAPGVLVADIALPLTTYDEVELVGTFTGTASSIAPYLQVSFNGGVSFTTSATYGWSRAAYPYYGVPSGSNSSADTKIPFAIGPKTNVAGVARVHLRFGAAYDPSDTGYEYSAQVEESSVGVANGASGNIQKLFGFGRVASDLGWPTHVRLTFQTDASYPCPAGKFKVLGRTLK